MGDQSLTNRAAREAIAQLHSTYSIPATIATGTRA
jgi:hypothetical protein